MSLIKKLILYVAGVTILLIVASALFLFAFGGLEWLVNERLSAALGSEHGLEITVGEISGSFFKGLSLKDVSVRYEKSSLSWKLAEVGQITAAYSISNLWNRNYLLEYLRIDSASVTLVKDSAGNWLIPGLLSVRHSNTPALAIFGAKELVIRNSSINLVENGDTTRISDIVLSAVVQGGDDTYSVKLDQFRFKVGEDAFRLDAASGTITYHDQRLVFRDLALTSENSRAKLSGFVILLSPISGRLQFAIDNLDLNRTAQIFGKRFKGMLDLNGAVEFTGARINGSVDIAGDIENVTFENLSVDFSLENKLLSIDTLYGTFLAGCAIDGRGELDFSTKPEKYQLLASITNFDLKQLVKQAHNTNLTGRIALKGESFGKKTMVLKIQIDLYQSSYHGYPLHTARGDLLVTSDSINFGPLLHVSYFENDFAVSGRLQYRDSIDLDITAQLNNLDRYRGKLFIDRPGGRGFARGSITGRTIDPDLNVHFISDSLWIYGLYTDSLVASVNLDRFLSGKKGTVDVDFFNGHAWSYPFDTGHASLTVDSNLVFIDSVSINNRYSRISGSGEFNYGVKPYRVLLDTLSLGVLDQEFGNRQPIVFYIDSAGFDFKKAVIGGRDASFTVAGRVNFDESLSLDLNFDKVKVAPWLKLGGSDLPFEGILSGSSHLAGTFMNPEFSLRGSIDSLIFRTLLLGDLSTSISYADRLLSIDTLFLQAYPGEYYARGTFPIDLAFTTTPVERLPEAPIDISVVSHDSRFDLVSLLLPSVEQLDGQFYSNFRLTGTANSPHLEGQAVLHNGRLKYYDLEHPIFVDSAQVTMRDNRIVIEGIEAYTTDNKLREGRKRYANIEGEIVVKSLKNYYYDLDIVLPREFPFSYELDDISGKIEGELHVEGDTPPRVTGDLTLLSMKYLVNFAEPEEGSPIMMALSGENSWDLNINIDILSNYWIKNEDIDAEFSGQINLIRENGKYRFVGEMQVLRGRGYLFDKTFRLEPGGQVIFAGEERFNPRLDMIAHTRVPGFAPARFDETDRSDMIELGIHVTGTLDTVEINATEDSPFSREDILPLLVANYYASDTASTTGQLEDRISGIISTQASQIGTRQLNQLGVGVETFEIEPFYGRETDPLKARITVGFYTSPNLYVYGRSPLSGQSGQELGFEYRFNKSFRVEGRRDEDELYHLNFNLHWEY